MTTDFSFMKNTVADCANYISKKVSEYNSSGSSADEGNPKQGDVFWVPYKVGEGKKLYPAIVINKATFSENIYECMLPKISLKDFNKPERGYYIPGVTMFASVEKARSIVFGEKTSSTSLVEVKQKNISCSECKKNKVVLLKGCKKAIRYCEEKFNHFGFYVSPIMPCEAYDSRYGNPIGFDFNKTWMEMRRSDEKVSTNAVSTHTFRVPMYTKEHIFIITFSIDGFCWARNNKRAGEVLLKKVEMFTSDDPITPKKVLSMSAFKTKHDICRIIKNMEGHALTV